MASGRDQRSCRGQPRSDWCCTAGPLASTGPEGGHNHQTMWGEAVTQDLERTLTVTQSCDQDLASAPGPWGPYTAPHLLQQAAWNRTSSLATRTRTSASRANIPTWLSHTPTCRQGGVWYSCHLPDILVCTWNTGRTSGLENIGS